jgi:hypothetical protein
MYAVSVPATPGTMNEVAEFLDRKQCMYAVPVNFTMNTQSAYEFHLQL